MTYLIIYAQAFVRLVVDSVKPKKDQNVPEQFKCCQTVNL